MSGAAEPLGGGLAAKGGDMFVQTISGTVADPALLQAQRERWRSELMPGAAGFLGSTGGVTDDGTAFMAVRFSSAEAAAANSARPEQGQWWAQTAPAFTGDVEFHDCAEVDLMLDGGSDRAGFVQVMSGRSKDVSRMREAGRSMESDLRQARPDIVGGFVAWHGDGGFTQLVYFSSEAEARAAESAMQGDSAAQEWMELMDGPITFLDLRNPEFD